MLYYVEGKKLNKSDWNKYNRYYKLNRILDEKDYKNGKR